MIKSKAYQIWYNNMLKTTNNILNNPTINLNIALIIKPFIIRI